MFYLLLIAAAIPAYLLGSINGAIITSTGIYHKDIRKFGSGNPGLTNFYRVFGKGGAALVIVIDVLKSVLPVLFGGWLFGHFFDMQLFGREFTGFIVMLGHCFPLYYGFKGGKGVMAAGTFVFVVNWRFAVIAWGVFLLIALVTRYISLASILAGIAYPAAHLIVSGTESIEGFIMAALSGALLVFRHSANIKRLIKGEESRFSFKRNLTGSQK